VAPTGVVVRAAVRDDLVWRLSIEHTTTYRYSTHVRASFNEVRAVPQSNRRQTALETRVITTPAAPLYRYRDYWGTHVLAFDVAGAHDLLQVRAMALVETRAPVEPPRADWEALAAARPRFVELSSPSLYTAWDEELALVAGGLWRPDPVETVEAVTGWVHDALEYAPGTTGVQTSAMEAWRTSRGVCQDFTHLSLAMLRSLGVPARYVSGYLHPHEEATLGEEALGESHAWIEAWTGDWWGIDPTNAVPAGLRHVVVAQGRDYADVPPVKGIYAGTAEDDMSVEVRVTRVA
jgi:transglutaminase-like putative cysteine protease